MEKLKTIIVAESEKIFNSVVEIRRHIHIHPELSFEESETAKYICKILKSSGIKYKNNIAGNGIVAVINGCAKGKNQKTIALRADIDALPIIEENKTEYCSKNKGIMHACGHDAHTASLLGTAMILNNLKESFSGKVIAIFQPAEEKAPGGAKAMIDAGIFDEKSPDIIIAQHVEPTLNSGMVGFRSGMYMAASDEIYMTVHGKGGHGAMPHMNIDPVSISAQIIVSLQQLVSRIANPTSPCVLSFGKIIGNGATNVIPSHVEIHGTLRTMNEKWRTEAHKKIKEISGAIAKSMGGSCTVNIVKGYPALINSEAETKFCSDKASEIIGKKNVAVMDMKMSSEDFAYFAQKYPSVFYRLGVRNEAKKIISATHTSTFDIDENSLRTGMTVMSWLAINCLMNH